MLSSHVDVEIPLESDHGFNGKLVPVLVLA